jgi:hypothetical protein
VPFVAAFFLHWLLFPCCCRFGTISLLFLPALGWVAFNMAQPAFNQLNRMNEIKEEAVGATGGKARRR